MRQGKDDDHTFNATPTAEEVLEGKDLRGVRALMTGVSAGWGMRRPASRPRGAHCGRHGRDLAKATTRPRRSALQFIEANYN
jgi:hypothetical protein